MAQRLPFLISVPHGGIDIPAEVKGRISLDEHGLIYFSDPATSRLFGFGDHVTAFLAATISRVIVDLNRPPSHLPPRHQDGVVKFRTSLDTPVWREGRAPDIQEIHQLMLRHYFPYHAEIDRSLSSAQIMAAFDCHSMVPIGLPGQADRGKQRPLICLGNNGDREGNPRTGTLSTCPGQWIRHLADHFRQKFPSEGAVSINEPFSGGFISNAHYWHTGIPWIQVEVNRVLYEEDDSSPERGSLIDSSRLEDLKETIWEVLSGWYADLPLDTPRPLFHNH